MLILLAIAQQLAFVFVHACTVGSYMHSKAIDHEDMFVLLSLMYIIVITVSVTILGNRIIKDLQCPALKV